MASTNDEHALNYLCLEPCMWVGDFLDWCKPLQINAISDKYNLFTWIPDNSKFVYLIKVSGFTLVYVMEKDLIFFANPVYSLKQNCPVNSMFLCQIFNDELSAPRLAFLDVLYFDNKKIENCSTDRYMKLMKCQEFFHGENMMVQWCGELSAMTPQFLDSLPHKTSKFLAMCDETGDVAIFSRY